MRIALGCVVLVGCSAAPQASAPAPVAADPAASPCVAEVAQAEDASRALVAEGRLDAALLALESAPACAERRVTDAAAELTRALASGPASGDAVLQGWAAWLAGDRATAERVFARVLRAHVASGTLPRPFVAKRAARTTRVVDTTFASAVTDVIGGAQGALLFDVARAPRGTTAAPFRFVPGVVAEGPEGLVLVGRPSLHVASATGAPSRLPGGGLPGGLAPPSTDAHDHGSVLGGGRIAVLGARGRFTAVDLPSGAPRIGPAPTVGAPPGDAGAPVREGGVLVLCSPVSRAAFAWDPAADQLVQTDGAAACAFDPRRGLLVTLHARPRPRSPDPSYDVEVQVRALGRPGVVRAPLGIADAPQLAQLSFDERTGLVETVLAEHPKRVVRWVDPATGRDAHPGRARSAPRGLASLPTKEAGFFADLGALSALERPGRWLVPPMAPGPNMGAGWYQNGVRTSDGKTVAVIDAKRAADPNDGPLGADLHLLLARGDPPKTFADVPMRTAKWGPWQTIAILAMGGSAPQTPQVTRLATLRSASLDERFAAARWGWTVTVVDLQAGELRATVDTEESAGRVALLAGDFLVAGGELHDLSRARAVDRGADARIDPGLLPADVQTKAIPGGASFALSRAPTGTLRATPRGYALADGAAAPSWLYCLVGEWILPVETCSHRLAEAPMPR